MPPKYNSCHNLWTAGSMEEARRCANCKHVHEETFTSKQLQQKARDAAGFPCTGPAPVPHPPAPSRGRSAPDFLSPAEPGLRDWRASRNHAIGAGGDRRLESHHHVVARVVDSRTRNVNSVQTQQYQVEWKSGGFAWLDESDCHACKDAISAFESTPRQPPPEATSTAPNRAHQRPLVGSMSEQRVDSMRGRPRKTSSKMRSVVKVIKDNVTAQCEELAPDDAAGLMKLVIAGLSADGGFSVEYKREAVESGGGGAMLIPVMKAIKKSSKRRHMLAFFCDGLPDPLTGQRHSRKSVGKALNNDVSSWEWSLARQYSRWPGAGVVLPPKPAQRRQGISTAKLKKLMEFLCSPTKSQRFAHGHLQVKYSSGLPVTLDRVSLLKNRAVLAAEILHEADFQSTDDAPPPPDEERCPRYDPVTHRRCMNAKHLLASQTGGAKCKFTPSDACSPATIFKIAGALFGDEVKTLCGLDDIIVECRTQNFESMKDMVGEAADCLISVSDDVDAPEIGRLKVRSQTRVVPLPPLAIPIAA